MTIGNQQMREEFAENRVYIKGVELRPEVVFECGQAFRFLPKDEGYQGVARGRALFIGNTTEGFFLEPCSREEYEAIWKDYFDLNLSYEKILKELSRDPVVKKAAAYSRGMRLLNQEPFETLITFIVSANNNVGRIRKIVQAIAREVGKPIRFRGETLYTFPSPEALADVSPERLRELGAGYRAEYIAKTAGMVAAGEGLEALAGLPYGEAKAALQKFPGVGAKVADCILLFSMHKKNAFPADVWIRRVLREMYGVELKSDRALSAFVQKTFGEYGGIAQQMLFHYARTRP